MITNHTDPQDYIKDRAFKGLGVITSLLRSGIFNLAANPDYDFVQEERLYRAFLAPYNITYPFREHFMFVMTGQDLTGNGLGLPIDQHKILNEDKTFVDEATRECIKDMGEKCGAYRPEMPALRYA